jgi:hypothetical protein
MIPVLALALGALLGGCASFSGYDLVPGKSTGAEAEARMGPPSQRLTLANGDTALYFSRLPYGRAVFVVTLGGDGVMKSIEQRMARPTFAKVVAGSSTRKDVSELLGPPGARGRFERQQREWWEYRYAEALDYRVVWIQFSNDGVVREVLDMLDPDEERKKDGNDGRS